MGRQEIRVHTFLQEVELTIDKKTIGRQLVLQVTDIISVKPTMFFSLQYDTKEGKRKFLSLDKAILDHKIDKRHKPIQFYLRLRIHPPNAAELQQGNTKLVIYRELKQAIETGELLCTGQVATDLSRLAQEQRVEEYLDEVAKSVANYGVTQYNMKSDDGYPVLLRTTIHGITITAGTDCVEIPFSKMKQVTKGSKSLTILQLAPAPDVKVLGPDSHFVKEVHETIMVNYGVHRQLQGSS